MASAPPLLRQSGNHIRETQGHALNLPLIADPDRRISTAYGLIHPRADRSLTVGSVFVIGADKTVKLMITYPASSGRNFEEILCAIDSLQLTADFYVATPANWTYGEDVIIVPALSDEKARDQCPAGWDSVRPYMRVILQPSREHQESSPNFTAAVDGCARLTTGRNFIYFHPGSDKVGSR
jgi:hypothetical protein